MLDNMEINMDLFMSFGNAILFGLLLSLTIKWIIFHFAAYKLKRNQKGPLDRMIEITSVDILNGVIRKRQKKAKMIMDYSWDYDENMDDQLIRQPEITSEGITSIYNSFKENGFSLYLIPNEDIHIALKKNLLSDYSHYFLNDEINKIIYHREMKVVEEIKREEAAKRAQKEKQRELKKRQRELKEQQIEDSINI